MLCVCVSFNLKHFYCTLVCVDAFADESKIKLIEFVRHEPHKKEKRDELSDHPTMETICVQDALWSCAIVVSM